MKKIFSKRLGAGFMILLMNVNIYQAAAAQNFPGKVQLMKDIQVIDNLSRDYNTKTSNDKKRVENILESFEGLMGRKLSFMERSFLTLQFATMDVLPRFEVKDNTIQVYDMNEGSKDLLISLEVIDVEKNTFKFGTRVFQVDPQKPLHENIQHILKELQKGEDVSFWQQLNPFSLPQAHAEMSNWLKYLLIGGIALVVGIVIGKAIQKNKTEDNLKDAIVAERGRIRGHKTKLTNAHQEDSSGNDLTLTNDSETSTETTVEAPAEEPLPATGDDPAIV